MKFFESAFDMHAARSFEQNRVARLRERAQHPSGFRWVLEKKRGAGPKACTRGCVQRATSRAAYSNEHIKTLLRGVSPDVAMQRLSPAAEFEHLPQNRDSAPRGRVSQHVDHRARRVRVGVVAIVKDQNSFVIKAFAAHFSGPKVRDRIH